MSLAKRSLAVKDVLDLTSSTNESRALYFYCSGTLAEPERANGQCILRCLVKQGLACRPRQEPERPPRYVVKAYIDAETDGFAAEGLNSEQCCAILSKYAIDHATTYIILDAFDECGVKTRQVLMDAFNSIIQKASKSVVKVLVTSRDDLHSKAMFDMHKTHEIRVSEHRNQNDIESYLKAQLDGLVQQKRISLPKGKASSIALQDLIVERLSKGAQGM